MADLFEFELPDPPSDGVSALAFHPSQDPQTSSLLLAASWDKSVNTIDIRTGELKTIGHHDDAVKAIEPVTSLGCLVTGGWDKTVRLFDPRASSAEQGRFLQPDKVYSLGIAPAHPSSGAQHPHRLVVAMAGRAVFVYDLRNMNETLQRRANPLKYQTRTLRCMPNGEGFIASSTEGRIAIEFFDPSPAVQAKKYTFKCHRQNENGTHTIYPVNALAFHPTLGTFASGGSDGIVSMWDGKNRKRIRQFPRYPTSVSALAFNATGDRLAIASSYTWDEGDKTHPPDAIFIRRIQDHDVRPKHALQK